METNNFNQQQTMNQEQSGLGIAGMVIGIISLLLACFVVGGFLGIVGLVLSIAGVTQKNKKTGMAIAGITLNAIAIVIMLLMFLVASSDSDEVKNVTSSSTTIQKEETTRETQSITESSASVFHVGETAEYKDVQISVVGYEESNGNDWGKPSNGNIFIFPEIEIVNNSTEEISVSSLMSFECYCDDYKTDFSSNAFMAMSTDDGKGQLDGSIAAGKKMKGVLALEVPSDWSTIEIYYKDNVWLGSDFSFVIEK